MNWSRIFRLAREMGWLVFGQLAAVTGTLVLVRVLTEHLAPETYGELALGLTLIGLINQVVLGGVVTSIGRYYSIAFEKQELGVYLKASKRILWISTVIILTFGGLCFGGLQFFGYDPQIDFVGPLVLFSLLGGYGAAYSGILNAARLRSLVALHGGVEAWLKILLVLGAVSCLGASVPAVIAAYVGASMLVVGSLYFFLQSCLHLEKKSTENSGEWIKHIWKYSLPFSYWGVFVWAQQSSDRWALDVFGSREDVGLYAVLFQLGYTPIVMTVGTVVSFLGPIFYQRAGDATDERRRGSVRALTWRITLACLGLTGVGFALACLMHEWIFAWLVSPQYRSVSYLMPWMVLAGGLFAAGQMLALKLISDMQASIMTSAKIWTGVLGVSANFYAGSILGVPGVVGALVIVSGVYVIWMLLLARKNFSMKSL